MTRTRTTLAALCAALALTAGAAFAQSTPADRTTFVTFSGPVSLPGMTLPAGTYTFKIADSQTDRHIVQVFNREGTKLFTTLLAVPAQRPEPEGDPVITFKETPSNRPPAVHYWYYAGEKDGNELVYPKAQALQIAQASGEGVMAVDSTGTSIDDWKGGSVSRVTASDSQSTTSSATTASTTSSTTASTTSTTASTTTAEPPTTSTTASTASTTTAQPTTTASTTTAEPTTTASTTTAQPTTTAPMTPPPAAATTQPTTTTAPEQPAPTPPPATAAPTTPAVPPPTATDNARPVGTSGSLPKTASELPMVGLIGLLALGGAIAIRAARVS